MDVREIKIPGCYEMIPDIHRDARGTFVKTFHKENFEQYNLVTEFAEEYYSISTKGVLRGLHFQNPPKEHTKIVYCVSGEVLDVVVDLRVGSPTFGEYEQIKLSAERGNMIYIPPGLAHGFYVLSEQAIMMYKVTSIYSTEHDTGLLWNSVGIPWSDAKPILSERDSNFVPFAEFSSPFRYKGERRNG